jgi:hypothetical protein
MKIARHQRFSVAMVLYVCTLFSVLTYGFHLGQMSGQTPHGPDLVFCGSGDRIPGFMLDEELTQHSSSDMQLTCPLCTLGHGSALTSMEWSVGLPPAYRNLIGPLPNNDRPAPRFTWPALNPRAPPVAVRATVMFS